MIRLLLCYGLAGLLLSAGLVLGASLETRIKAAFLYKFCSYVEWPEGAFGGPDSPIVIGVVDADSLGLELKEAVKDRRVGARPLEVRTLAAGEADQGLHLLYLGNPADTDALAQRLRGKPVLLVSNGGDGLAHGSSISFDVEENRVRFDISVARAEANGLRISSRLLAVARRVEGGTP